MLLHDRDLVQVDLKKTRAVRCRYTRGLVPIEVQPLGKNLFVADAVCLPRYRDMYVRDQTVAVTFRSLSDDRLQREGIREPVFHHVTAQIGTSRPRKLMIDH